MSTESISDNDGGIIVTDDELSLVDEDELIEKTEKCSLTNVPTTVGRIQKYRFSHGDIVIGKVKRLVYCRGQQQSYDQTVGLEDKQLDTSTSSCRLTV